MRRRHQSGRSVRRAARRRKLILTVAAVLLGGLVWFAPGLLLNSPLKEHLVRTAARPFQGQVVVGPVSAGWLSPLSARSVVVIDAAGERLLEADTVQTEKPLLMLLFDRRQLGRLRIERPRLALQLRSDGSNLEDAIRPWLEQPSGAAADLACEVQITEGQLAMLDVPSGAVWTAEKVNAALTLPSSSSGEISLQFEAEVAPQNGPAGSLAAELHWNRGAGTSGPLGETGNVSVRTARIPLRLAEAALRRFEPQLQLDGTLNGGAHFKWADGRHWLQLQAVEVQDFSLQAASVLGTDRLVSQSIRAHGSASSSGANWRVDQLVFETDFVNCQASGLGVMPGAALDAQQLARVWQHGSYQIEGTADLARLSRMLPSTLRIRQETYISSGLVSFSLRGKPLDGGQTWEGRLETTRLAAMYQGAPVIWEKPVQVTLRAQRTGDAIEVEELTCHSNFLELAARGTLQQGSVAAHGDLNRFVAEIGRFVDLGDLHLAGQLHADLAWQQDSQARLSVRGTAAAEQFEFATPDSRPWREERLTVTLSARGAAAGSGLQRLDQASLLLESQGDHLQVELVEAVAPVTLTSRWPLRCQVAGELSTWLPRLQRFVALPEGTLSGVATLDAEAEIVGDRIQVPAAKLRVSDLRYKGLGLFVREPSVEIETAARWSGEQRELSSTATTLAASALAFRADQVRLRADGQGLHVSGDLGYRGDLARVLAWIDRPGGPPDTQLSGQVVGRLRLAHQAGATTAEWTAGIDQFAVTRRATSGGTSLAGTGAGDSWQTIWYEPRVTVEGTARYDVQADRIALDQIQLAGESVSLGAEGQLQQPWSRCYVELDGRVAYDLQRIANKLRPWIGESVQMTGRDSRTFRLQGPLRGAASLNGRVAAREVSSQPLRSAAPRSVLADLVAEASLSWSLINVHGFAVGAGQLQTQLSHGVVRIDPLELPVSEGRARLEPRLDLTGQRPVLLVPRGSLEQVRITPEMCRAWLKYVTPLVADATAAEGKLSVLLDNAAIPLDAPSAGEMSGELTVHSAQIGPGPLAREFLWIAEQVKAILERRPLSPEYRGASQWLLLPEQQVKFALAKGRVEHRGLQMTVKDVIIRTRGSVGLDQTIALIAEVPIRDEWVARDRYLSALRGQSLEVPISGTLSQPKLDRRALDQLAAQLVSGTATRLLERELQRGLDRLFAPPN